jgi:hypothetical protein
MIRGKTRIALAWAFVAMLGFFAREYPTPPGIVLCFAGATLLYWASGYLRKDSRPAVGGPYAWVRNPLYLGTYLMAVGTAWAIGQWVILATLTVGFATVYHYIILDEETKLLGIFGAPYERYCQLVPRFFPRPWPADREALREVNPEGAHHEFDRELAAKNKAYEAYVSFAGMIGLIALAAWIWQR